MPVRKKNTSPSPLTTASTRTTDALQMTPEAIDATLAPVDVDEDEPLIATNGILRPEKPQMLSEDGILYKSLAYKQITVIMCNGANSLHPNSKTRFLRHQPLMQQLIAAYRRCDTAMFLLVVEQYLKEAVKSIPQAGREDRIPTLVNLLRQTIEQLDNLQEWRRYSECIARGGSGEDLFFTVRHKRDWYSYHDTGVEIVAKKMFAAINAPL